MPQTLRLNALPSLPSCGASIFVLAHGANRGALSRDGGSFVPRRTPTSAFHRVLLLTGFRSIHFTGDPLKRGVESPGRSISEGKDSFPNQTPLGALRALAGEFRTSWFSIDQFHRIAEKRGG